MKINRVLLKEGEFGKAVHFVLIRQEGERQYVARLEWEPLDENRSLAGSKFENEMDRLAVVQFLTRAEEIGIRSDRVREENRERGELAKATSEHLNDMRDLAKTLAGKVGCNCRSYGD